MAYSGWPKRFLILGPPSEKFAIQSYLAHLPGLEPVEGRSARPWSRAAVDLDSAMLRAAPDPE